MIPKIKKRPGRNTTSNSLSALGWMVVRRGISLKTNTTSNDHMDHAESELDMVFVFEEKPPLTPRQP